MIERDYILNLFAILGRAIAKLALLKEQKKYEEALLETDEASLTILGLRLDMLSSVPFETVKNLLGTDRALADPKLYVAGRLLKERGEILELQGKKEPALSEYMKSLQFIVGYLSTPNILEDTGVVKSVDFLVEKLDDYNLPLPVRKELVVYNENLGRLGKSEDIIFEILDDEPGYIVDAITFYRRILLKSDQELEAGDLPRVEAEESLTELEKRQN